MNKVVARFGEVFPVFTLPSGGLAFQTQHR